MFELAIRRVAEGATRPSRGSLLRKVARARSAYIFVAPFCAFFAVFTLLPIVLNVLISFQRVGIRASTWVGPQNYADLAGDTTFMRAAANSVVLTMLVVPVATVLGLFVAVIASKLPRRWQHLARGGFYLPSVASGLVLTMVWLWILHPVNGLLNFALKSVGAAPIEWLGNPDTALYAVALVVLSFSLGQPVVLFLAGLDGIPKELYEAARLDGASAMREFRHISLPLLRPALALVVVVLTLWTFQVFVVIKVMTLGGPANATQSLVFRIWQIAFTQGDFGHAAAMAVMLLLFGLGLAAIQIRLITSRVTY